MFLYRSNRSERLVDALAEVVRTPQRNPLAPELIVVQSKGMERWLALELSQRLGVFANAQFPFPRHLLGQLSAAALGEPRDGGTGFDERTLSFAIAALLPSLLGRAELEPLARYLEADRDGVLRMELAERLARVLDDYAVYRPELLSSFERGEERGWEAVLWRALVERLGRGHQAARAERLITVLGSDPTARAKLPERLCLFGIASLPPLYVEVLSELGKHVETHLFVLSPCRAYFADLRKPRARGAIAPSADEGHPLLVSLGRLGRELQQVLEEHAQYSEDHADLYVEPSEHDLLHTLQADVLDMRNRGAPGSDSGLREVARDDHSVSIQICHSPMREIEVLHDQLVAVLEDCQIEPHDIVVMAPNIETYAPVIEAVFGQRSGRPQLPFSVADRKTRTTHEAIDALYALLAALQGRMTSTAVLDLLSLDCVRRRFEIAGEELDTLRDWVERSGIRWGVDAEHRAAEGQPSFQDNTFRFGLDRMLLGYALEGRGQRLYAGVLPLDGIEGSAAALLGKLSELCERLFRARTALRQPRPLPAWRDALNGLLDDFLDEAPDTQHQRALVQSALASLDDAAAGAGFDEPIGLRTLEGMLERALDERLPARGLLSGGITFCQLVPMRSIPFQVVCLIGMNDQAFPGSSARLGFDRMAEPGKRRAGDRNRRDDDRYMFLEALLSARQRVLISYVGRGVHDNRVMPPSVVVGELLDAIGQGFTQEGLGEVSALTRRAALEERLCTVHRLHAFSPHYFTREPSSRLFSYATQYCESARALGQQRARRPLLQSTLSGTSELRELTIDDLVSWLSRPIRNLLQRELGLYLGDDLTPLEEREPLVLDRLAQWKLGDELLRLVLEGKGLPQLLPAARAQGVLPLGTVGVLELQQIEPIVATLASTASAYRDGSQLDPLPIELEVDGVRVTGTLHDLWPRAHLCVSFSKLGRSFELRHFVRHVLLGCALRRDPRLGYPLRSVTIARDGEVGVAEVRFEPLDDPEAVLSAWLDVVREARRRPLPFDLDMARAYQQALHGGADLREARRAAAESF
ncbi:MAG: exodeoxyribonuclease V subunit gamma, partial [Polyangiales bacterium]